MSGTLYDGIYGDHEVVLRDSTSGRVIMRVPYSDEDELTDVMFEVESAAGRNPVIWLDPSVVGDAIH